MSGVSQRSFASGEITPALYARTDTAKFQTSLKTMRNTYVLRHGGSANRPGTAFIGEVKDSTKRVRLVPFIFSNAVTYVLEFGNLYMRVIKNGQYVMRAAQTITSVTNANPAVLTYLGVDNFYNGRSVKLSGIVGPIGEFLNGRIFNVANMNPGANTFELQNVDGTPVDSTAFGSYTSGGSLEGIYEIDTPYLEEDLPKLKYVQSADVMTFTHNLYAPRDVRRFADANWDIGLTGFRANVSTNINSLAITSPGGAVFYVITASNIAGDETTVDDIMLGTVLSTSVVASPATPVTLSWGVKGGWPDPYSWNIYKSTTGEYGTYGYVGTVTSPGFVDNGVPADSTTQPPVNTNYFSGVGKYPAMVAIAQQRKIYASTINEPEAVWASKTGAYGNFYKSTPITEDSPIKFSLAGNQVTEIRNLIDLGSIFMLTDNSDLQLEGDQGVITPFAVGPKDIGSNGSAYLAPLKIGNTALFVQSQGAAVMDLNFDYQTDGYRGNEVSLFASHLVDNYEIVDWAYQKKPHSIAWMVRSDGTMISLTYNREQQIFGWARHDLDDAVVESICSVPEGREYSVYLSVMRTVNGRVVRSVERMASREINSLADAKFMDSHVTYDGRNIDGTTVTLSGGTDWTSDETLTLTASAPKFTAEDVGKQIHLRTLGGAFVRFTVVSYTSPTVVTGNSTALVPLALRSATAIWSKAIKLIKGLYHLEGKTVSVLGDGFVVSSPYNISYDSVTVVNGQVELSQSYSLIHIGLPYVSDIETLPIDTVQGESIGERKTLINSVTVQFNKTCGLWFGHSAPADNGTGTDLVELKPITKPSLNDPLKLESGKRTIKTVANWENQGRVFLRQVDPLPMSILSIAPAGFIPLPQG